jgi:hypothetical protein
MEKSVVLVTGYEGMNGGGMDLTNWQPYHPDQLASLLAGVAFPYWLTAGYALEYFVGTPYRDHADLDIAIRRSDQHTLQQALPDYHFYAADPPGTLRPWHPGEYIGTSIHDVWVKAEPTGPFVFQLMFLDTEGDTWLFRRDPRIRGTLSDYGWQTQEGMLVIAPQIQLLYKAKGLRDKDEVDFQACLPKLSEEQKQWLKATLQHVHPDHRWIGQL